MIEDIQGVDGAPPYLIRWTDDRDDRSHLYYPGPDAHIETRAVTS